MNTLGTSLIAFALIFGGALLGFRLRSLLPESHLSTTSRDVVKLSAESASITAQIRTCLTRSSHRLCYRELLPNLSHFRSKNQHRQMLSRSG